MGVRSLFAGVSGLRNFQLQMDIIGNNISNSQTAGYKTSRITFEDLLSQTTQGATGPSGGTGGTNPQQFGLGAAIGAIDTDFGQGNLLTTGRQLDLAISGNGFFKVSDGSDDFYTRNGAFDIDEAGNLVSTTNGYIVQGYNATNGILDRTAVGGINIPIGIVLPALETTTVDLVGNLNSTDTQTGSIHESGNLLATELQSHDSDLDGLFAVGSLNSRIAGLQPSVTTVSVTADDGVNPIANIVLTYVSNDLAASDGNFNSLADLEQELNNSLAATNYTASLATGDGALRITNGGAGAGTFTIVSNNSSLNSALSSLGGGYAAAQVNASDEFTHTATEADLVTNLRDDSGTNLGLVAGDIVTIDGTVGGTAVTQGTFTVQAASTLADLDNRIATTYNITNAASNVEVIAGKVRITGDGGTDYSIDDVDISTGGVRTVFDGVFDDTTGNWAQIQQAGDNHTTSFIAHDSDGVKHTITIKYNIRDASGGVLQWVFDLHSIETATGTSEVVTPASGTIQFNPDGSLNSFSPAQVTIFPSGTAYPIQLTMSPGTVNGYDGLVSFENDSSARFADITGYASGELQNITVNAEGVITGNFTNGQNQVLSQLILSMFDNEGGLEKFGGNLFNQTLNSGVPVDAEPGSAGRGTIIPSALEGSNVDLAQEFVTLITAQRGFQTNARMITAANDILGELVNLVR